MPTPVLADTSAWVDFLQARKGPGCAGMGQLLSSRAAVLCHLVRAELLPFMPRFPPTLSWLPVLSDPPDLWDRVIACQRILLRHGGPAAVPDLILVATALHHRIPVFSTDDDFERYAAALPLKLWTPPDPGPGA